MKNFVIFFLVAACSASPPVFYVNCVGKTRIATHINPLGTGIYLVTAVFRGQPNPRRLTPANTVTDAVFDSNKCVHNWLAGKPDHGLRGRKRATTLQVYNSIRLDEQNKWNLDDGVEYDNFQLQTDKAIGSRVTSVAQAIVPPINGPGKFVGTLRELRNRISKMLKISLAHAAPVMVLQKILRSNAQNVVTFQCPTTPY